MAGMQRVLSVQSHVVHGYVGNRAAVFPLQLLGFEVDVINSVQFSCHTGYPSLRGQRLQGEDLEALVQGLAENKVLDHTHLLTGYIGTPSFLREVVRLRGMLPQDCCYICDPVLGDNGVLYVPRDLVDVYREEVLPVVTVLTPNQFEAELLTQRKIGNLLEAAAACDALHAHGIRTVVLTTLDTPDATCGGEAVAMLLSEVSRLKWLLQLPFITGGPFTGTGDLTAAMILAWTQLHPHEAPEALERVGAVLQAVLKRTTSVNSEQMIGGKRVPPELRIVDSKRFIESPEVSIRCHLLEPQAFRGVIFDMDGTLMIPGQINFQRMRERTGVPADVDLVTYLRNSHASDETALASAMAIIDDEELQAFAVPRLQPGVRECIERLRSSGVRVGMVTKTSLSCVHSFLRHSGLGVGTFSPTVTRDSGFPSHPDPAWVLHCCTAWGIPPDSVLAVSDTLDDLRCARAAGSRTVAMLVPDAQECAAKSIANKSLAETADFAISSLGALQRLFAT